MNRPYFRRSFVSLVALLLCYGVPAEAQTKFKCSDAAAIQIATSIKKHPKGMPAKLGVHKAPTIGEMLAFSTKSYRKAEVSGSTRTRNVIHFVDDRYSPEKFPSKILTNNRWMGPKREGGPWVARRRYTFQLSHGGTQNVSFHFCSYWVRVVGGKPQVKLLGEKEQLLFKLNKSETWKPILVKIHKDWAGDYDKSTGFVVSYVVVSPESYVRKLNYSLSLKGS